MSSKKTQFVCPCDEDETLKNDDQYTQSTQPQRKCFVWVSGKMTPALSRSSGTVPLMNLASIHDTSSYMSLPGYDALTQGPWAHTQHTEGMIFAKSLPDVSAVHYRPVLVDSLSTSGVRSISANSTSICVATQTGTLLCWGDGPAKATTSQLNSSHMHHAACAKGICSAKHYISPASRDDGGSCRTCVHSHRSLFLPVRGVDEPILSVSGSRHNLFAITETGGVLEWKLQVDCSVQDEYFAEALDDSEDDGILYCPSGDDDFDTLDSDGCDGYDGEENSRNGSYRDEQIEISNGISFNGSRDSKLPTKYPQRQYDAKLQSRPARSYSTSAMTHPSGQDSELNESEYEDHYEDYGEDFEEDMRYEDYEDCEDFAMHEDPMDEDEVYDTHDLASGDHNLNLHLKNQPIRGPQEDEAHFTSETIGSPLGDNKENVVVLKNENHQQKSNETHSYPYHDDNGSSDSQLPHQNGVLKPSQQVLGSEVDGASLHNANMDRRNSSKKPRTWTLCQVGDENPMNTSARPHHSKKKSIGKSNIKSDSMFTFDSSSEMGYQHDQDRSYGSHLQGQDQDDASPSSAVNPSRRSYHRKHKPLQKVILGPNRQSEWLYNGLGTCALSSTPSLFSNEKTSLEGALALETGIEAELSSYSDHFLGRSISVATQAAEILQDFQQLHYKSPSRQNFNLSIQRSLVRRFPLPRRVPEFNGLSVTRISASPGHYVALTSTGLVLTWGRRSHGRLGYGLVKDLSVQAVPRHIDASMMGGRKITSVASGWAHTLFVTDAGQVYSLGCGLNGRLGNGGIFDHHVPTHIKGFAGAPVVAVAAGASHSLALDASGQVWAWGANQYSQLGLGHTLSSLRPVPVSILRDVTPTSASEYGPGMKEKTQLGFLNLNSGKTSPVEETSPSSYSPFARFTSPFSSSSKSPKADSVEESSNLEGYFSQEVDQRYIASDFQSLNEPVFITKIACGPYHSAALSDTGEVFVWGWNRYGQLGLGTGAEMLQREQESMQKNMMTSPSSNVTPYSVNSSLSPTSSAVSPAATLGAVANLPSQNPPSASTAVSASQTAASLTTASLSGNALPLSIAGSAAKLDFKDNSNVSDFKASLLFGDNTSNPLASPTSTPTSRVKNSPFVSDYNVSVNSSSVLSPEAQSTTGPNTARGIDTESRRRILFPESSLTASSPAPFQTANNVSGGSSIDNTLPINAASSPSTLGADAAADPMTQKNMAPIDDDEALGRAIIPTDDEKVTSSVNFHDDALATSLGLTSSTYPTIDSTTYTAAISHLLPQDDVYPLPVLVPGFRDREVIAIACGPTYTAFVTRDLYTIHESHFGDVVENSGSFQDVKPSAPVLKPCMGTVKGNRPAHLASAMMGHAVKLQKLLPPRISKTNGLFDVVMDSLVPVGESISISSIIEEETSNENEPDFDGSLDKSTSQDEKSSETNGLVKKNAHASKKNTTRSLPTVADSFYGTLFLRHFHCFYRNEEATRRARAAIRAGIRSKAREWTLKDQQARLSAARTASSQADISLHQVERSGDVPASAIAQSPRISLSPSEMAEREQVLLSNHDDGLPMFELPSPTRVSTARTGLNGNEIGDDDDDDDESDDDNDYENTFSSIQNEDYSLLYTTHYRRVQNLKNEQNTSRQRQDSLDARAMLERSAQVLTDCGNSVVIDGRLYHPTRSSTKKKLINTSLGANHHAPALTGNDQFSESVLQSYSLPARFSSRLSSLMNMPPDHVDGNNPSDFIDGTYENATEENAKSRNLASLDNAKGGLYLPERYDPIHSKLAPQGTISPSLSRIPSEQRLGYSGLSRTPSDSNHSVSASASPMASQSLGFNASNPLASPIRPAGFSSLVRQRPSVGMNKPSIAGLVGVSLDGGNSVQGLAANSTGLGSSALGGLCPSDIQAMGARYREKLIRDARDRHIAQQQDAVREIANDKANKERTKQMLLREQKLQQTERVWMKNVLYTPDFMSKKSTREQAQLLALSEGVPPKLRREVWLQAIGNRLGITPELFSKVQARAVIARKSYNAVKARALQGDASADLRAAAFSAANLVSENPHQGNDNEEQEDGSREPDPQDKSYSFKDIDVDLTRTFPALAFYQEGSPMKYQMRAVLDAFCFYQPKMGYVQGMSYLAGKLLLYMGEYDAFVCLANMVEGPFFRALYSMDTTSLDERYDLFESLLRESAPDIARSFEDLDIFMHGKTLYFIEWCMTLFCKRLEMDVIGRIWDGVFLCGESIVYRTAVALLICLKPQLIGHPFETVYKTLTRSSLNLSERQLVEALGNVRWTMQHQRSLESILQNDQVRREISNRR